MSEKKLNKREKFAAAQTKAGKSRSEQPDKTPNWWAWLPAVLGFLVYANTLGFDFALDDYAAILENNSTKRGLAAIGEIFSTSYRYGYLMLADDLYRPLPKAIYAVLWEFWPDNASPGHWLNVLLYSFTCFLLFRFLSHWFPRHKKTALIAAVLFAVHPLHTEVVSNIKSMDEILGFILGIQSLHLFLMHLRDHKKSHLVLSMVLLFLACCSKESSITFLLIYPLFGWFALDIKPSRLLASVAFLLMPVLAFLFIRYQILYSDKAILPGPPSVADNMLSAAKDPLTRIAGAVAMLGYYGLKLVFPVGLSFDRSYPEMTPASPGSLEFIMSAAIFTGLLIAAIRGLRSKSMYSLALLSFFILVSVPSNIFVLIGTHYGERLMYAPLFAYCLLLALVIEAAERILKKSTDHINEFSPMTAGITGVLVLVFSGITISRNPVWKDNGTLYASGLVSAPNSSRVHYYQGLWLNKPEKYPAASRDSVSKEAIYHLKKSVELYPAFSDAWTQLGVAYYRKNAFDSAFTAYQEALKYNPYDPVTLNNLGSVYFSTNKFDEALKMFLEAIRYKPDYADALMNIGSCYGAGQKYDLAITYFQKAVAVDPSMKQAYYFLGITYRNIGNETLAVQYLNKAASLP